MAEDSTDLSQLNPDLQLEAGASGHVTIKFNKRTSDGVNIYSRRAGEAQSTFLARDSFSPYVDNRPNLAAGPEKREYFGVYVENDDEIGPASPVVSVTLG